MCNQLEQQQLFSIFDKFFADEQDELSVNRFKQIFNRYPKETGITLLLEYYAKQGKIAEYQLEKRLFPLASEVYMGIMLLVDKLDIIYLNGLKEKQDKNQPMEYCRRFCRAMLIQAMNNNKVPLTAKKRIGTALTKMRDTDNAGQQWKLENKLPFDSGEVFLKLRYYLVEAEIVADLPCFLPIYFTQQQLNPMIKDLENFKLTAFSRKHLQQLLDEDKKQQIRLKLQEIIYNHPIEHQAKQAYAIYLSLNQFAYDWVDHPFVRRFLGNSYLEAKVAQLN